MPETTLKEVDDAITEAVSGPKMNNLLNAILEKDESFDRIISEKIGEALGEAVYRTLARRRAVQLLKSYHLVLNHMIAEVKEELDEIDAR